MKFVDIHTHQANQQSENEIKIISFYQNPDKEPFCFFSIGKHPWYLNEDIEERWFSHTFCVAVGECGLDKVRSVFSLSKQTEIFTQHLDRASDLQKPVILHVVRAHQELIQLLKKYPHLTYIWHGFNGSYELFRQFERFHMFFSFGVRSSKNTGWKQIPLERVLLETDDSLLSIREVYSLYAQVTGISFDAIVEKIYQNAKQILGEHI